MKLGIFLTLLLCVASTCSADPSCKFSSGKDKYDFKDLGTIDYKQKNFDYRINLCNPVDCDAPPAKKAAVCQNTGKDNFSCGTAQSQSIKETEKNKLEFKFAGGTPCKNSAKSPRSSVITLECSKGTKYKVTDSDEDKKNCIYTFTIQSEYACASTSGGGTKTTDDESSSGGDSSSSSSGGGGGGGGLDGGWIFLIVVLCLAVVYVGGGMAWNYKRNELRGTEMIPNRGMWTSLPGLVKDGCIFTVQKVSCGRMCGDYDPL